jgi:hypothetical protein
MAEPIGRHRNKEWRIGAAQAFFHRDGTWFNRLKRFPGALCDPNGYVRFETEVDYLNCPYLDVRVQTNAHRGINHIPGYIRVR